MSDEMRLFDYEDTAGLSRRDDPVTSSVAAKSINLKARKAEVLSAAMWLSVLGPSFTASQVHAFIVERAAISVGMKVPETGSVRSRLNQLATDGLVRKTGGVRVDPAGTGRPEQLWSLTDEGRAYLSRSAA